MIFARKDDKAKCKLMLRCTQWRCTHTHLPVQWPHTKLKYLACFLWIDATVCIFFTVNGHSAVHIYIMVSCLVEMTKLRVDLTRKFNNCIVLTDNRRSQRKYLRVLPILSSVGMLYFLVWGIFCISQLKRTKLMLDVIE